MISEAMDHYLVSTHRNDCTIDLSSDEEVERFIDEATWSTRLAKFKSSIYENTIAGAVISHTGLQKVMDHEKRLKQVRLSSALLIRLVSVLELLLDHGVPFVFIVPWPEDSREDIRTSPRAVRLKDLPSHHFIMVGDCTYQAVATSSDLIQYDDLSEVLRNMATMVRGDPVANHKRVLQEKLKVLRPPAEPDEEDDEDMTRQVIKQPLKLHDRDLQSERQKQNAAVIGGMKNPIISLHKLPGHRPVGKKIATIISKYRDEHPEVEKAIINSIGDTTKTHTGPSSEQVAALRKLVEEAFNITDSSVPLREDGKCMTELNQQLYEAWVKASGDPDVFLPQWLKNGAPTGLVSEPEDAGIFPRVREEVPDDLKRNLTFHDETFLNYKSLEDSEFSSGILQ